MRALVRLLSPFIECSGTGPRHLSSLFFISAWRWHYSGRSGSEGTPVDSCTIMTPDGRNYPLARGRTKPLVVGREKGVAIRIYQGAGVSPQHASFS